MAHSTPSGSCAPVKMTLLPRKRSMKLSALAVYAIVSVPCTTTKPLYES